jgi:DNA polymerase III epsilon subunit family exonuclease
VKKGPSGYSTASRPRKEPATISLLSQLRQLRLAFLDVETTGTSPRFNDRITEVGIRVIEGGQVVEDFQQLVNPARRIPTSVVALTGITQEMVDAAPVFEEIEFGIARRLRGSVVIGHNVRFDLGFIKAEFDRTSTRFDELVDCSSVLDTVRLARKMFGRGGNGLQKLAARLGIRVGDAHRALADAITTAEVFDRILTPHGGYDLMLADVIALQGGASRFFGSVPSARLPVGLEDAIRQRDHVRMVYLDSRNNRTERIIVPLEVRTVRKVVHLSAFCTLHQERRMFEVARIVALTRIESLYDDADRPGDEDGSFLVQQERLTDDE